MSLSRIQVLKATTTSRWTKDFRHMLAFPRHWMKRTSRYDPHIKAVPPKQRLKYWSIVPGDQIRVLGEPGSTIHEVQSINKISNRVYLKGIAKQSDKPAPSRNVHYSRCQLFIGNYEFPPEKGSTMPSTLPVFVQRLGRTKPYWNSIGHRWQWRRVAAKTTPSLPKDTENERIIVPWPKIEKPYLPEPSMYDTPHEAVSQVTYKIPAFPLSAADPIPKPLPESVYVNSLFNPTPIPLDSPVEVYLYKELSNPHSRAKKQARWQAYKCRTAAKLKQFIEEEVKNLNGRTVREARAEAAWKWHTAVEEERNVAKKRQAKEVKMIRRKARRERREKKKRERLTEMVLREAPNQFIPSTSSSSSL